MRFVIFEGLQLGLINLCILVFHFVGNGFLFFLLSLQLHQTFACIHTQDAGPYPPEMIPPRYSEKREEMQKSEDQSGTLRLLVAAELEVLASLES